MLPFTARRFQPKIYCYCSLAPNLRAIAGIKIVLPSSETCGFGQPGDGTRELPERIPGQPPRRDCCHSQPERTVSLPPNRAPIAGTRCRSGAICLPPRPRDHLSGEGAGIPMHTAGPVQVDRLTKGAWTPSCPRQPVSWPHLGGQQLHDGQRNPGCPLFRLQCTIPERVACQGSDVTVRHSSPPWTGGPSHTFRPYPSDSPTQAPISTDASAPRPSASRRNCD